MPGADVLGFLEDVIVLGVFVVARALPWFGKSPLEQRLFAFLAQVQVALAEAELVAGVLVDQDVVEEVLVAIFERIARRLVSI